MKLFSLDLVGDTNYGNDAVTSQAIRDAAPAHDVNVYKSTADMRVRGDELQTRSHAGSHNHQAFTVKTPIAPVSWLTYQVRFDEPFDFGGNQKTWARGGKLPGMMRGDVGSNTGGNHSTDGWSGRLMWRGTGTSNEPPTGTAFSGYLYADQIDNIAHQEFGETFLWRELVTHGEPVQIRSGWNTLIIGYSVLEDQGTFDAYELVFDEWVHRCHVENIQWMNPALEQGADRFIWQTYWGGAGDEWLPDVGSTMRFRRIAAFDSFAEAGEFAREEETAPVDRVAALNALAADTEELAETIELQLMESDADLVSLEITRARVRDA